MTRSRVQQETAEGLSTSEQGIGPYEPTAASVSLPSPNLRHESVLVRELQNRLSQFDTALEVVVAEKDGLIMRHEQDAAERQEKHNLAIAELERQAQDIDRGRSRLIRALRDDDEKGSDDA